MPEHLLEMAKALVLIKDGKIKVLSDPKIRHCPLRKDLYGCDEESRESVERVLKEHIQELGMYSSGRILELDKTPVSFGASEMIMDGMSESLVDAAVVVCEGAGTVIVQKGEVLQAIGAHMTGLMTTEPVEEIQSGLEDRDCTLLGDECEIDQVKGYAKAIKLGFERIAVTITGFRAFEAKQLWEMGKVTGKPPIIMAVHNTGIDAEQAQLLAEYADIVWACASKQVREVIAPRSKIQIGVAIPVYAVSEMGKRLVLNRAMKFQEQLVIHRASLPHLHQERQPDPLL
ncbi:MAG TPA: methanogenesis marker 8 protein [Methanomassiliicoccales archaeon]|nr:methanogenesis marker 8 protein [Methanomassiliicoccales archaeon]